MEMIQMNQHLVVHAWEINIQDIDIGTKLTVNLM